MMLACLALATVRGAAALQPIREIQKTAAAEGFAETRVEVAGVVTWVDPTAGRLLYIQDATAGIQVNFKGEVWPKLGTFLSVEGLLVRGDFAPAITGASYEAQGGVSLPRARAATGGGLLNGAYSCERVIVDGWIRSAKKVTATTLSAVVSSGSARITIRISDAAKLDPDDLVASKIYLHGVATPVKARGGTRQLVDVQVLAPDPTHLSVREREAKNPWPDPVVPLASAFSYRPGQTRGDRIHVAGQVIYQSAEILYLNDGTAGMAVRGSGFQQFRNGDRVEAVGFMDIEMFIPVLSDAVVIKAKQPATNPILPRSRNFGDLLDGLQHADHVSVAGELIDRMETPGKGGESTLVYALRTPEGVFLAEIELPGGKKTAALDYEIGSMLEVAGVCLVATDMAGTPTSFKILIPEAGQIRLLAPASFFTVRRLLVMLSAALGILALAASYAFFSTRRNMRLLAEIGERRAVTAERSRLARDLHDTLEQGLTGIHLQLHSISPALEDASAETQERLMSVRSLVLQCHTEMRQSIWDLRSGALEQFDLGDALKRIADTLVLDSNIEVELRQQRNHVKIPPLIEDNLLRIGQESLTNAVKHAKPTRIKIELDSTPGKVTLTISDNGSGSESLESRPGHFGLVGMRERSVRIGGALSITRNSAGGCSVRVDVPLRSKQETSMKS